MFDFHTHRLDTLPGEGIVCLPQDALLHPERWLDAEGRLPHAAEGALYAAGIHPWWVAQPAFAASADDDTLHAAEDRAKHMEDPTSTTESPKQDTASLTAHLAGLKRLVQCPEVVQIGECGLDTVQGEGPEHQAAPLAEQETVLRAQIALSESVGLPLTLHCVRAFDHLLRLRKELRPTQRWTIHGFRGRPALATQLLAAGFDLSYGPRRNEESYAATPPDRRHDETDAQ